LTVEVVVVIEVTMMMTITTTMAMQARRGAREERDLCIIF
jgi:hypothetical protein